MQPDAKPFLSLPAAARALGIPYSTAWEAFRATGALYGVAGVHKRGNRYVFSRIAIERLASGGDVAPDTTTAELPVDWFERT